MEIIILIFLILLNGVFAMAEIAIITARKSTLQSSANTNDLRAKIALKLANSPSTFLSTIQIGISFIGIFAGAYSGGTIAKNLTPTLESIPFLSTHAHVLSMSLVVIIITYFTLVIGELVPKRLALSHPEIIAKLISLPLYWLSLITLPIVKILSLSTDTILRLLGVSFTNEAPISDHDIKALVTEGARTGIFQLIEKNIVERTLSLSDTTANVLMIKRENIIWLDVNATKEEIKTRVYNSPQAFYPVCSGSMDNVIGSVHSHEILKQIIHNNVIDLETIIKPPLFIKEQTDGLRVLELFKQSGVHMGLVINAKGIILGLISLTDILEALVGSIPTSHELENHSFIVRKNGSVLVDGSVSISEFANYFKLTTDFVTKYQHHTSIANLVSHKLNSIPIPSDTIKLDNINIEVIDTDDNRIDKLLITTKANDLEQTTHIAKVIL